MNAIERALTIGDEILQGRKGAGFRLTVTLLNGMICEGPPAIEPNDDFSTLVLENDPARPVIIPLAAIATILVEEC